MTDNYLKKELYDLINNDPSIFEFIQSGSLDGIWYWDLENPEMEWMSPKFWQTLGYDPKAMKHLSSEWQGIIFKEDLEMANLNFQKHCDDPNHPYDQIVRYKHKNGSTIWIRCRGLATRDENGVPIRMLGAHTDITELKVAENEISRLKEEYEKVFNGTQDAMFLMRVLDQNEFRYIRNNLAHQIKTKVSLETIRDKSPDDLLGKEKAEKVKSNYRKCLDKKTSITYEETLNLPGGQRIWLTTLTPVIEDNLVKYIVGSATDITERKILEMKLEEHANYDKLTGLPNRRLFFERLNQMVLENQRDKSSFALAFIDLDGFKTINDTYGHEFGDKVLIIISERLSNCVRKSDTTARMGGDEFTMILRHIKEIRELEKLMHKILEAISKEMTIEDISCSLSASIGISLYPDHGGDSESLLRNADRAM